MKKTHYLIAVLVFLASCVKNKDEVPAPVPPPQPPLVAGTLILKKDTSFLDQTSTSPKNNVLVGKYKLTTGNSQINLANFRIHLSGATGFDAVAQTKNLSLTIKHSGQSMFSTGNNPNPMNGENFYSAMPASNVFFILQPNTVYDVEVRIDFIANSLNTEMKTELEFGYYDNLGQLKGTGKVSGQTVTVGSANISATVSSTTPEGGVNHANQSLKALDMVLTASGQTATTLEMKVTVSDATLVERIDVYDGNLQVGSGTISGNTSQVMMSTVQISSTPKTLSIVPKLKPITSALQSGNKLKVSVTEIRYMSAGESKTKSVSVVGNEFTIFKSYLKIEDVPIQNTPIYGNQAQPIRAIKITAIGGDAAWKQLGFYIVLQDNGHNDTLFLSNMSLEVLGVGPITNGAFNNVAKIDTFTEASNSSLYFSLLTGPQLYKLLQNQSVTFVFKAKGNNFNKTAAEGDAIGVKLIVDNQSAPGGYRYATKGSTSSYTVGLYNGPAINSGAKPYGIIWTDLSDPANSGVVGFSTEDFFSGYLLDVPTTTQVLFRKF